MHDLHLLTHRRRAHLLMIPNDQYSICQEVHEKPHDIRLARFVDDHEIEVRFGEVEVLHDTSERHDPDRDRGSTLLHGSPRLASHSGYAARYRAGSWRLANNVLPADERLLGSRCGPLDLLGPCALG